MVVIQARMMSKIVNSVYLQDVFRWLLILLTLIIFRGIFVWIGEYVASSMAIKIKTDLRVQLYNHLNELGPNFLKPGSNPNGIRTGEMIEVINQFCGVGKSIVR